MPTLNALPSFDLKVEVKACGCCDLFPVTERALAWLVDFKLAEHPPSFREIIDGGLRITLKADQARVVLPVARTHLVIVLSCINPATATPSAHKRSQDAAMQLANDLDATMIPIGGEDPDARRN